MSTFAITGAAGDIGRATARRLVGSARIALIDIDEAALARAARDLGRDVRTYAADISDEALVRAVADDLRRQWGSLAGVVNNAGIAGGYAPIADTNVDDFDRVMAVNIRGTLLGLKHLMPLVDDGGAVVNVASVSGVGGYAGVSAYVASKHAVIGLTRTAAIEYAQHGIRVNAVCPGAIDTPMMDETFARFPGFREGLVGFVPMGRMGEAAEVAAAIAWLQSDAASFVTGEALTIEGGLLAR